jgi:predicted transcriptional regulator
MKSHQIITESAVDELAQKLPQLSDYNYSTIDKLMQRICKRHAITGNKLHDLFVSKYGHTPDAWIKKIKSRETGREINEAVETPEDEAKIKQFIEWSYKALNIQDPLPRFDFCRDTEQAQKDHRTGMHDDKGNITIYIENRNLVDIFRTIFHELVHHRQDQLNMIKPGDSYPGSPIEAMADMMAGKYIKIYGKQHPEIFQ